MNNNKTKKRKMIDTRIIQLGRWHVPRTQQIDDPRTQQSDDDTTYLVMGYFDMLHVKKVDSNNNVHVFRGAYDHLMRNGSAVKGSVEQTIQEEYAFQELMIFTNVGDNGFSDAEIEMFWDKENPLIFVSMIHIDNDSNIEKIIKRIKNIFEKKDFLYYFAFDYSGIILLSKERNIEEHLKLLFELNYGNEDSKKKLVRDSYSFWGFDKEWISQYFTRFREFDKQEDKEKRIEEYKEVLNSFSQQEQFSASINIGVQNYEIYKEFQEKLQEIADVKTRKEYGMLGRHDISIVKEDANLGWLIYMQYVLNELSIPKSEHCYDALLSTHETFIKIENIGNYDDGESEEKNNIYKKAAKDLNDICEEFSKEFQKKREKYNGQYQHAIYAVRNSLLSILKNRYAEDFVLCVYRPFTDFVKYLTKKMKDPEDSVLMFNKCYKNFFECLNSLVNSAMHSERQFIQATAFNALIYDVPSKILAFYMALINDIKEIMSGEEDKNYTFILTPSFSNEIEVEVLSYPKEKELPHNRILKVEINEKSLYNPPEVEACLVHEIGHFLGDDFRCREIRKERILFSVIYLALIKIFHAGFINAYAEREEDTDSFERLADSILQVIKGLRAFSLESRYYSVDLYSLGKEIAKEFQENIKIKNMLAGYIRGVLSLSEKSEELTEYLQDVIKKNTGSNEKITDSDILNEMIIWDIEEEMQYLNVEKRGLLFHNGIKDRSIVSKNQTDSFKELPLGMAVNILLKMYYEAYADIQMVLITGMGYQDYLMGFFKEDSSWELPTEGNLEDIGRISMVSMVMQKCGMWEFVKTKEGSDNLKARLNKLHGKVSSMIQKVELLMHDQEDVFDIFREKYAEYILEIKWVPKEGQETEQFEETIKEETMVDVRICFELLRYLFRCVEKCIGVYSREKKEKICKIRKEMEKVNNCNDIQEVFVLISKKITKYRDTIFPVCEMQGVIKQEGGRR